MDAAQPARWMGRASAVAFLSLIAIQEICGPSLEALCGWKFSDWILLAFLGGGAFWLVVSAGARWLQRG